MYNLSLHTNNSRYFRPLNASIESKKEKKQPVLLTSLPNEVLEIIFSYLEGKEQNKILLVNRQFFIIYKQFSPFGQIIDTIQKIKKGLEENQTQQSTLSISQNYQLNCKSLESLKKALSFIFKDSESTENKLPTYAIEVLHVAYSYSYHFHPSYTQVHSKRLPLKSIEFNAVQKLINDYLIPSHLIKLSKQIMKGHFWDLQQIKNTVNEKIKTGIHTSEIDLSFNSDLEHIEHLFNCMNDPDPTEPPLYHKKIQDLDWSYCYKYPRALSKQCLLGEEFIRWTFDYENQDIFNNLECDSLFEALANLLFNPCYSDISHLFSNKLLINCPHYFFENKTFVLTAAEYCDNILQQAPDFTDDEDVVLTALYKNIHQIDHVDKKLLEESEEVLIKFLEICTEIECSSISETPLSAVPLKFKNDREVIKKACIAYPPFFEIIDHSFKEDKNFLLELIEEHDSIFEKVIVDPICTAYLVKEEFYLEAYERNNCILQYIYDSGNQELVFKIIRKDKNAIHSIQFLNNNEKDAFYNKAFIKSPDVLESLPDLPREN